MVEYDLNDLTVFMITCFLLVFFCPHEKINRCLTDINRCLTNIFKI